MNETMLTLKPSTILTERNGQSGLTLQGHTRLANDGLQAEILRALSSRPYSPESLTALLRERDGLKNDNEISLAIAEFILVFGEFLES